jgi:hypothetical protein
MSARRKLSLWQAIDPLEAQESLSLIRAFCYTNMKDKDREAFDSKLKSTAYPPHIYLTEAGPAVDLKDSFLYKLKGRVSG